MCNYVRKVQAEKGPGFPNRSVFSGKGPDPDLFVLQGPENGPDFTEKSGFLS